MQTFLKILYTIGIVSITPPLEAGQYTSTWETGEWTSGLKHELQDRSYGINSSGSKVTHQASKTHYIKVKKVDWAKSGNYVLKVYADAKANRSEFSFIGSPYRFNDTSEHYFAASIRPDNSWKRKDKYSVIITQWKMFNGGPHATIRLSNSGDNTITFHAVGLSRKGIDIAKMPSNQWTDIKVYFKNSLGKAGITKVWVNGVLKVDRKGKNILRKGEGYVKMGMYTEIRKKRILYFDDVFIGDSIKGSQKKWATSSVVTPMKTIPKKAAK